MQSDKNKWNELASAFLVKSGSLLIWIFIFPFWANVFNSGGAHNPSTFFAPAFVLTMLYNWEISSHEIFSVVAPGLIYWLGVISIIFFVHRPSSKSIFTRSAGWNFIWIIIWAIGFSIWFYRSAETIISNDNPGDGGFLYTTLLCPWIWLLELNFRELLPAFFIFLMGFLFIIFKFRNPVK